MKSTDFPWNVVWKTSRLVNSPTFAKKDGTTSGSIIVLGGPGMTATPWKFKIQKKWLNPRTMNLLHRARLWWLLHLAFLRWSRHILAFENHLDQFLHSFGWFHVARLHRTFVDHVTILRADSRHDNEFGDFLKVPNGRRAHVSCIRLSNRRVAESRVEEMFLTHDVELQCLRAKTFVWVEIWLFQVTITAKHWAADKATKKALKNISSLWSQAVSGCKCWQSCSLPND